MVQYSNQEMRDMHFVYGMALVRPAGVRTIQIEEAVLNKIEEDPTVHEKSAKFKSCNGMANFERSATLSISYTACTSAYYLEICLKGLIFATCYVKK
ncbi:unnamed protein product [Acanthoscelides obtectus]|uniref:Uncharacterized protein n=1 Tax=Acanthoscelides obtectus TaxID=200917 RepID=A0A9P0Q530_ACAOB|nr:unnamed protein product [Acanthoscelides obtectus]CAK1633751.1 hypothetical protein AOBTE_LOCUS8364 [Acanthoscelides obtectus]